MSIHQLHSTSISRICYSQVIPSMTACVRELVENSLDANATSISVRVRNRGSELEVADNGSGILESDWPSVCAQHSTSKIFGIDDISSSRFRSHGFRGEALSALCALASTLRIVTRTNEQEAGTVLTFSKMGELSDSSEKVSKSVGTTVTVYGLFQDSLPVRFVEMLSNEKKEVKAVNQILVELAILHPSRKFELLVDGKSVMCSSGGVDSFEAYKRLINGGDLVSFECAEGDISCSGWISPTVPTPMLFKSTRVAGIDGGQFMFLNDRPMVPNKKLFKGILGVYAKYNINRVGFILRINITAEQAYDSNASVDKRTILFAAETEVRIVKLVVDRLEDMFAGKENNESQKAPAKLEFRSSNLEVGTKRQLPNDEREQVVAWTPPSPQIIKRVFVNKPHVTKESEPVERPVEPAPAERVETPQRDIPPEVSIPMNFCKSLFRAMEVIGQFNNGFIITRLGGLGTEMFLIDQHAANEKFLFESYYENIKVNYQMLISPITLKLNPAVENTLVEFARELSDNGFRIEFDDTKTPGQRVKVLSLPTLSGIGFNRSSALTIADLTEIIERLTDEEIQHSDRVSCRMLKQLSSVRSLFASKACRTAVMVGDSLARSKMVEIVTGLSDLQQPWNCPHGRPTFKHLLSAEDLLKLK